jgi:hypothetical protein
MAKIRNKWREARDLLVRNALRKPIFGTLQPFRGAEDLEADVKRLIYVLNQVSDGDPRVYSLALQSSLAFVGIGWPDGVFKHDFNPKPWPSSVAVEHRQLAPAREVRLRMEESG